MQDKLWGLFKDFSRSGYYFDTPEKTLIWTAAFQTPAEVSVSPDPPAYQKFYPESQALYDYKAKRTEGLSFKAEDEKRRLVGRETKKKVGVFPSNFVLVD